MSPSTSKWLAPDEARQIAEEAYVYALPLVQNYLSIYQFALDSNGSQYKGPMNGVHNVARVFTPADTGVITPNSDTPYSFLVMDLRAEPMVVTMPKIEDDRYYSLQLVDLYTHNIDYLGTRTDGNGGGNFLIAGPDWSGTIPEGVRRVIRMPTSLVYGQIRTQLFNAADIEKVKQIQNGYKAQALSKYLNTPPPPDPPKIAYPPIDGEHFDPQFWEYANLLLQFCPVLLTETALRAKYAQIGMIENAPWPPPDMPEETVQAIREGQKASHESLEYDANRVESSVGLFGTLEEMAGRYRQRAIGALAGIYGNSTEEAVYPAYVTDPSGLPYDTSKFNFTMTFKGGELPPVHAFWSVTIYDMRTRLLVENPLNRYLINSTMLADLKKNTDGGITLYIQHASPGPELESNWLPAPDGPAGMVARLYLPKEEVLNGTWKSPPITRVGPA